jgi:hypothetical protein
MTFLEAPNDGPGEGGVQKVCRFLAPMNGPENVALKRCSAFSGGSKSRSTVSGRTRDL